MNPLGKVLPVWALLVVVTTARSSFSWNIALSCVLTIAVLVTVIQVTRAVRNDLFQEIVLQKCRFR